MFEILRRNRMFLILFIAFEFLSFFCISIIVYLNEVGIYLSEDRHTLVNAFIFILDAAQPILVTLAILLFLLLLFISNKTKHFREEWNDSEESRFLEAKECLEVFFTFSLVQIVTVGISLLCLFARQ